MDTLGAGVETGDNQPLRLHQDADGTQEAISASQWSKINLVQYIRFISTPSQLDIHYTEGSLQSASAVWARCYCPQTKINSEVHDWRTTGCIFSSPYV